MLAWSCGTGWKVVVRLSWREVKEQAEEEGQK